MRVDVRSRRTRFPAAVSRRFLGVLGGGFLSPQSYHLCHFPAVAMDAGELPTPPLPPPSTRKRPFCNRCSKPASVCLCSRLRCPPLDNPIGVTILQHSMEGKHALNSARVASLGLRNVAIVPVTDVLFSADYDVRPLFHGASGSMRRGGVRHRVMGLGNISNATAFRGGTRPEFETHSDVNQGDDGDESAELHLLVGSCDRRRSGKLGPFQASVSKAEESNGEFSANGSDRSGDPRCKSGKCKNGVLTGPRTANGIIIKYSTSPRGSTDSPAAFEGSLDARSHPERSELSPAEVRPGPEEDNAATVNCESYRVICSSSRLWFFLERSAKPDLSWVLREPLGKTFTSNGFIVRKLQRRQLKLSLELEEAEEFEIMVPPGSALLFPGKYSTALGAVDFDVKHLIVLDGTWDKAKRMFYENPWLQFLPHLKLESQAASLYSEVRHQPAPGCFSTVESIVYAMKALGNDMDGLDSLLDVFESMVGDQRRYKDEKFRRMARS